MKTNVLDDANNDATKVTTEELGDVSCDDTVIRLQPVLEAQAKHGPTFRRELFDEVYKTYQMIQKQKMQDQKQGQEPQEAETLGLFPWEEIVFPDIYGIERSSGVLKEGVILKSDGKLLVTKRLWDYRSLQHLGQLDDLVPFSFITQYVDYPEHSCFQESDICVKAVQWKAEWESSEFCRQLTAVLEHAGRTMHVNKIICFGLGCLGCHPKDLAWRGPHRSYVQHLAALTIRDVLAHKQGGNAPSIYAQDPSYCAAGIQYLKTDFNMSILTDPDGFKALDGNTFVITVAPNVPVRQLALGLTHDEGGPAGMMCDAILTDGLESDGKFMCGTCDPSPAVWKYKQSSVWMEYDDRQKEDCFGNIGLYLKRKE